MLEAWQLIDVSLAVGQQVRAGSIRYLVLQRQLISRFTLSAESCRQSCLPARLVVSDVRDSADNDDHTVSHRMYSTSIRNQHQDGSF